MNKNKWEKLMELPNEYEVNPDLAKNAIQAIQIKKAKKASLKGWCQTHWKKLTYVLAVCIVFVGVFIPVYQLYFAPEPSPQIVYYADETVRTDDISDIDAYVTEKAMAVQYFSSPMTTSQVGILIESGEIAYLLQNMLYMDASGFDQVHLKAVILQNAKFAFEEDYEKVMESTVYDNINIQYGTKIDKAGALLLLVKFSKDHVKYYMEIQTVGETEMKVLQYVAMLLQK